MLESSSLAGKTSVHELAILGGAPLFAEKQHVGRPNIGNRDRLLERMADIIDRRWLTNDGPYVREFEMRVADLVGAKHCIAMCNATVALEIAIRALDLKGEVIVPSFTFVATAHALQWQEITPVFADVDPNTHLLDPRQVERMITPRTTGILGVHLWGSGCDVEGLADVANRHNLKLLFDAAHAFGCTINGKMIGNFGDAEVFSFHGTKFINSFEGGAVITNNDELARRIRLMRNFGFSDMDCVTYVGTNGKMCEASAAMGITSLESMSDFIAVNKRNRAAYKQGLSNISGLTICELNEDETLNYQYLVLEIDAEVAGISRDQILKVLHAENILARRYFYPGCHRMEPYKSFFPNAGLLLPNTERLCTRVLSLPTGTGTTVEDIAATCDLIRFVVENHATLFSELEAVY